VNDLSRQPHLEPTTTPQQHCCLPTAAAAAVLSEHLDELLGLQVCWFQLQSCQGPQHAAQGVPQLVRLPAAGDTAALIEDGKRLIRQPLQQKV
jgi:hypothetical protein